MEDRKPTHSPHTAGHTKVAADPAQLSIAVFALAAIAVIRLWMLPMGNSLWLDETLIVQIIRDGLIQIPVNAPATQSVPFCWIEWFVTRVLGTNEIALRLPSLLAGISTLYVYYRMGLEIRDRETGLFFACIYLSIPQVSFEIPNARPYSIALTATSIGLLWFLRWLRSKRTIHGLLWILFSGIASHIHYFFIVPLIIAGLFVFWHSVKTKWISSYQTAVCGLVGFFFLLPIIPQVHELSSQARMLSFAPQPSVTMLLKAIFPITVLTSVTLVAILALIGRDHLRWAGLGENTSAVVLGLLIVFTCSLGFFLVSRLTDIQIFLGRYLLPTVPGLVLMWGTILRAIEPPLFRRLIIVSGLTITLLFVGGYNLIPDYRLENWKSAVAEIPPSAVTVAYTGLVEARNLSRLKSPEHWHYLLAPIITYRPSATPGNTFLLPFHFGSDEHLYVSDLLEKLTRDHKVITLITLHTFWGPAWGNWVSKQLSRSGFRQVKYTSHGIVSIAEFRQSIGR